MGSNEAFGEGKNDGIALIVMDGLSDGSIDGTKVFLLGIEEGV